MLTLLIIILLIALVGGGFTHGRYGGAGWSPLGIILLVFVILYFTGRL